MGERNSKRAPRTLCRNLKMLTSHGSMYKQRKTAASRFTHHQVSHSRSKKQHFSHGISPEKESHICRDWSPYFWSPSTFWSSFLAVLRTGFIRIISGWVIWKTTGVAVLNLWPAWEILFCSINAQIIFKKIIIIASFSCSPWTPFVFGFSSTLIPSVPIIKFTFRPHWWAVAEILASEALSGEMLICFALRGNNVTWWQAHQQQVLTHIKTTCIKSPCC